MIRIVNPYQFFTEVDGSPLDFGKIYIGTANQDPEANPITVYWDAALTIPASQPLQTISGYIANTGTPAPVYVSGDYSIRVKDARDNAIFSAASVAESHELLTSAHGVTGNIVGTGGVQTLTDKTLTAPTITSPTIGATEWTNANHTHLGATTGGLITVDKVKVSANDTTAGYLNGKLVAGAGVTLTEGSDGGNETLTIAAITGTPVSSATLISNTFTTIETIDTISLGTVNQDDVFLCFGSIHATKGATGGMCEAKLSQSSGTGTIKFLGLDSISQEFDVPANEDWAANLCGFCVATVAGTVVLKLEGKSEGSSSATSATLGAGLGAIRIKR